VMEEVGPPAVVGGYLGGVSCAYNLGWLFLEDCQPPGARESCVTIGMVTVVV
jgi:hypothetical protein